jgi:3-deoxy-7-phosphoheptulonate synthase
MIIPVQNELTQQEYQTICDIATEFHCKVGKIKGEMRTIYPIIGDERHELMIDRIEGLPFVDHIARMQESYKLMAKGNELGKTHVKVGNVEVGKSFILIAGQCTIDPKHPQFFLETAHAVKEAGASIIRGGVWKPRTNPHSFQGDDKSMQILLDARAQTGLPVNTEVMDEHQLKVAVDAKVDMIQIGARNALNYGLLRNIAAATKDTNIAVILKRSIHMGPIDEYINAAEYLAAGGNTNILLSPRGTMPTEVGFRYNPDESITMLLKKKTWAPVVIDPSHSVGLAAYVPRACLAAAAYGADGIMVETHVEPKAGIGDDPKQSVTPDVLAKLFKAAKTTWELSRQLGE